MLVRRKRDGRLYHLDPAKTYIDPTMPNRGPCVYLAPHWSGPDGGRSHYKSVVRFRAEYVMENGGPLPEFQGVPQ